MSSSVGPEDRNAIGIAWRDHDYGRAATLASALADHDDRRQILKPLVAEWVASQPMAAVEFVVALAPGVERREFLEVAIRGWSERDLVAASAWLNALEPHPDLDAAVAAVATSELLVSRRPQVALSWAESIAAPTLRADAIGTVALSWARQDEKAAMRYLETCPALTTEQRERMGCQIRDLVATIDEEPRDATPDDRR